MLMRKGDTPGGSNHVPWTQPWPSLNSEQRDAILEEGGGLVDLWEASPIRIDENRPRTSGSSPRSFT